MSKGVDEDEHSLEMHLPYIYKMLSLKNTNFQNDSTSVPLVPIMVGNTDAAIEAHYGSLLAPYLSDPSNVFVISSDFCHWGSRFRYTYYQPADGSAATQLRVGHISSSWISSGRLATPCVEDTRLVSSWPR